MAVGEYLDSAGIDKTVALFWNGRKWVIEPSPSPSSQGSGLFGVSCTSRSTCTAAGAAVGSKNPSLLLVEMWNGTTWSTQQAFQKRSPLSAGLDDVSCTSSTFCLAVGADQLGDPIADIWNGTSWKATPTPAGIGGGGLFGVTCLSTTDCIAVGSSSIGLDGIAEKWNGKTWKALSTPPGEGGALESVSCTSDSSCVAVGSAYGPGGLVPLAEAWNGAVWTLTKLPPLGVGIVESPLYSVSCGSSSSCTAVGVAVSPEGTGSPLIYAWNGTKWSTDESVAGSPENLGLTGVACTSASRCIATGYFFDRLGSPEAFSETSAGSSWTAKRMPTPPGGAVLYGLQCSGSSCVAVGGDGSGALAEGWNGKGWTLEKAVNPVGSGTSTYLDGVGCASQTSCTAVGDYTNSTGFEFTLAEAN